MRGLLHWELAFAYPSIQTVTHLFWFSLRSSAPIHLCLLCVETLLLLVVSSLTLGRPGPAGRPSRVTSLQGLTKIPSPKLLKCFAKEKHKERKRQKGIQPLPFYHITWARTQWLLSLWPARTEHPLLLEGSSLSGVLQNSRTK